MPLHPAIEQILIDDSLDLETVEDSKCDRIEQLIESVGWDTVRENILDLLLTNQRRPDDYQVAAEVLWGAVLDKRELPANRVIALLYNRLDPRGDSEHEGAWAITMKLKKLDYLSDYRPLEDPAVQDELAKIRSQNLNADQ